MNFISLKRENATRKHVMLRHTITPLKRSFSFDDAQSKTFHNIFAYKQRCASVRVRACVRPFVRVCDVYVRVFSGGRGGWIGREGV